MPVLLKRVPVVPAKGASRTTFHDNIPQHASPAKPEILPASAQGQSETRVATAMVPTATLGSSLFKPQASAPDVAPSPAQKTSKPLDPQISLSISHLILTHIPSATVDHDLGLPSLSEITTVHQSQTRPTSSSSARISDDSQATSRNSHNFANSETVVKSSILPGSTNSLARPSSIPIFHTSLNTGFSHSPFTHKTSPAAISTPAAHTMPSTGLGEHQQSSRPGSGHTGTAINSNQFITASRTGDKTFTATPTEARVTSRLSVASPTSSFTRPSNLNEQPGKSSTSHPQPQPLSSSESPSRQSEPPARPTNLSTAKPSDSHTPSHPTPSSESPRQSEPPPRSTSFSGEPVTESSPPHSQTPPSVSPQSPTAPVSSQTQAASPSDHGHHPVTSSAANTPSVNQPQPTSTPQPKSQASATEVDTTQSDKLESSLAQTAPSLNVISTQASNDVNRTKANLNVASATPTSSDSIPTASSEDMPSTPRTGSSVSKSMITGTTSSMTESPPAQSSIASQQQNNTTSRISNAVIGGSIAAGVILIAAIVALILCRRRKRQRRAARYHLVDDAFHAPELPKMSYTPVSLVSSAPPYQQVFHPAETNSDAWNTGVIRALNTGPKNQQSPAINTANVGGNGGDTSSSGYYQDSIYKTQSRSSSGTSTYASVQEDFEPEDRDTSSIKPRINSVGSNSTAKSNVQFGLAV